MNEEEIINRINFLIYRLVEERKEGKLNIGDIKLQEAIQGLLDLYNKEKEKNKNLLLQLKDSEKELLEVTKNIISKDKIREILENYKYTEITDNDNIVKFYKEIKELLGDNK